MSIRAAAEAVVKNAKLYSEDDWHLVTGPDFRDLEAALDEPNTMAEACEIIDRLRKYVCGNECDLRGHVLWCERAREFLKRHGGGE